MPTTWLTEKIYDNFVTAKDAEPDITADNVIPLKGCVTHVRELLAENDNAGPQELLTRANLSRIANDAFMPPELAHLVEAEGLLTKAEATGNAGTIEAAQALFDEAQNAVVESEYLPDILHYAQMHLPCDDMQHPATYAQHQPAASAHSIPKLGAA